MSLSGGSTLPPRAPRPSFRAGPRPNVLHDLAPADLSPTAPNPPSMPGPSSNGSGSGSGSGSPHALAPLPSAGLHQAPPADPIIAAAAASNPDLDTDDGSDSDSDSVHLPACLIPAPPVSVLLFRQPLPTSEGTDPYHDAFGNFCLPSYPTSALESGSSTPLPPPVNPNLLQGPSDRTGAERLRHALELSKGGQRRGRWIADEPTLTTHHLSPKDSREIALARKVTHATLSRPGQHEKEKPAVEAAANAALEVDDQVEWSVTSMPILETGLVHLSQLSRRLINGAEVALPPGSEAGQAQALAKLRYRGVVMTSQRAVEAYVQAAEKAADQLVEEAIARGAKTTHPPFTAWNRIPFFVIGPATEKQLRNVGVNIPTPFRPRTILGGSGAPNADALGKYIIRHFADTPQKGKALNYGVHVTPYPHGPNGYTSSIDGEADSDEVLAQNWLGLPPGLARNEDEDPLIEPLLVLTGDKNLPTLRDMLGSVGLHPHLAPEAQAAQARAGRVHPTKEVWQLAPIPLEELQVYETHEDPAFEEHLHSYVRSLPGNGDVPPPPPTAELPSSGSFPSDASANGNEVNPEASLHVDSTDVIATGLASGPASSGPSQNQGPGPNRMASTRSQSQPTLEILAPLMPMPLKADLKGDESAVSSGTASPVLGRRPSLKATKLAERLHAIHVAQKSQFAERSRRAAGLRSGSLPPGALRPTGLTPLVPEEPELSPKDTLDLTSAPGLAAGPAKNDSKDATHSRTPSTNRTTQDQGVPPSQVISSVREERDRVKEREREEKERSREARWDSHALEQAISERQWAAADAKHGGAHCPQPDWIVFFSPSGVQYALPHLRKRGWLPAPPAPGSRPPAISDPLGQGAGKPRVATLGGTTKRWIRDNLHFWPDATAVSPTPNELMSAIAASQRLSRTNALKQAAEKVGVQI